MDIKVSGLYKTLNNAFRKSAYSQSTYDTLTLFETVGPEFLTHKYYTKRIKIFGVRMLTE